MSERNNLNKKLINSNRQQRRSLLQKLVNLLLLRHPNGTTWINRRSPAYKDINKLIKQIVTDNHVILGHATRLLTRINNDTKLSNLQKKSLMSKLSKQTLQIVKERTEFLNIMRPHPDLAKLNGQKLQNVIKKLADNCIIDEDKKGQLLMKIFSKPIRQKNPN